jgi:hypothetical protein
MKKLSTENSQAKQRKMLRSPGTSSRRLHASMARKQQIANE